MVLKSSSLLRVVCLSLCVLSPVAAAAQTPSKPASRPTFTLEVSNEFTNPGAKDANQDEIDILLTKQASLRSTWSLGVNYHDRWSDKDLAFVVGAGHAFGEPGRMLLLSGSIAIGAGVDNIPLRDYKVNGEFKFNDYVNPVGIFERQEFPKSLEVNSTTVGLNITPIKGKKTSIQPVFIHTWAFVNPIITENGNAFGVSAALEASSRVSLTLKGGYGHEHAMVHRLTVVEVVESLQQLTLEPGISVKLDATRGISLSYRYEDKKGKYAQHGFTVGGFVNF